MKYWDKAITLTTGCDKVSPACLHCWAETNHNLRMRKANKKYDHDFTEVKVHPENISIIDKTRKPTTFSVWNDAFHPAVPFVVLDILFEAINRNPQHTYLICTKRPERISEWLNRAENYSFLAHTHKIFLGTTLESDSYLRRVEELLKCRPFKLFLSIEPMLSAIKIPKKQLKQIDYVIAGCESGHHARETKETWIGNLYLQCVDAGVPLWIKQLKLGKAGVIGFGDKIAAIESAYSIINKEELWK